MAEQRTEQNQPDNKAENPSSAFIRFFSPKELQMRMFDRSVQTSPNKVPIAATAGSEGINTSHKRRYSPPEPLPEPKPWRWSLVWLALLSIFGGLGAAALLWLVTLPPPTNCSSSAALTLDGERLYCAREAAQSGELPQVIAGLDLVKQWDEDHPLQGEAQKLREEWSKRLLLVAREKINQSDIKGALAIISHIPKNTQVYAEVQKAVLRWKKQWQQADVIAAKAQVAMKQQKWDAALEQISLLNDSTYDYWLKRAGTLSQQLGAERQAWQVLAQAKKLAAGRTPQQLSQAIAQAQQVPAQTYANPETRVQIKQWSNKLLSLGVEKWKQGDTTTAATLLHLPFGAVSTPEVEDLLQFGGAYRLAGRVNSRWLPSLQQVMDMQEAIAAIRQVKPESSFYAQAQVHQKNWQAQLQDMIQLQYATTAASLGQRDSLKLAIAQAKQVNANRPRYGQAQTLISYWTAEVQRLEDQPYLARAQTLAKSGDIAALKAAIAEASRVPQGRVLRQRSQDLMATWQDQIETLEDQPWLDQSLALADQGELSEAIDRAGRIQAGRALYAKAQALISDWQMQQIINAQIAVDQPILDRASTLASSGDLTAAINTAAQISPGRVLYSQAQGSIARWRSEREAIYNPPQPRDFAAPDAALETDPAEPSIDKASPSLTEPSLIEPQPLPSIELVPPHSELPPTENRGPASDPTEPPPIIVEPELIPSEPEAPAEESQRLRPRASYDGYYDERYYQNQ